MDMATILNWLGVFLMLAGFVSVIGIYYLFFDGLIWFMLGSILHVLSGVIGPNNVN